MKPNAKGKGRRADEPLHVLLTPEEMAKVRAMADAENITLRELVVRKLFDAPADSCSSEIHQHICEQLDDHGRRLHALELVAAGLKLRSGRGS